jgi:hypothetical protein
MNLLLEIIKNIIGLIKKSFGFFAREFFLLFIYSIVGLIISVCIAVSIQFIATDKTVYQHLYQECGNSKALLYFMIFIVSLTSVYLYRLLWTIVKKQFFA